MRYSPLIMGGNWLVISAGVTAAAAGLYLLIACRRSGFDWPARIGAGLVFLSAAVVAQEVFQPTGTFLGLLSFLFGAMIAVGCLIAVSTLRRREQGLAAFAGAGVCVASLLLFNGGVVASVSVLLLACVPAVIGARLRFRRDPGAGEATDDRPHEPLWGCLAWGALVLGMLRCLCVGGAGAQAVLNNQLAVGNVVTATGALILMVRRDRVYSVLGLGAATLGLVLLLSAFGRFHGEPGAETAAVVILCGAAGHAAVLLWLDARCKRDGADHRLPEESAGR